MRLTRSFVFIIQNNNDLVFIGRFISPDAVEKATGGTQKSSSSSSSSTTNSGGGGNSYAGYSGSSYQGHEFNFASSSYKIPTFNLKDVSRQSKFNFFD